MKVYLLNYKGSRKGPFNIVKITEYKILGKKLTHYWIDFPTIYGNLRPCLRSELEFKKQWIMKYKIETENPYWRTHKVMSFPFRWVAILFCKQLAKYCDCRVTLTEVPWSARYGKSIFHKNR